MKKFAMIVCLVSFVGLVGCASTQTYHDTSHTTKKETKQVQKRGSYFGTGVGVGFVAF